MVNLDSAGMFPALVERGSNVRPLGIVAHGIQYGQGNLDVAIRRGTFQIRGIFPGFELPILRH